MWATYEILMTIGLIVVLIFVIIGAVFISRLDDIDTDDETITWSPTSSSNIAQFVSVGNMVTMTLSSFTATLSGGDAAISSSPIPDDFWPTIALTFFVPVTNNGAQIIGSLVLATNGIMTLYAGPTTTNLFTTATTVGLGATAISWTQDL